MPVTPEPTGRSYLGLFLLTLATLMYEILLTRIFSVTMWYHFAFMAISLAMFGMTVGALIVYLRPATFTPERTPKLLALTSLLFGASVVVSFMTHLSVPVPADSMITSAVGIWALFVTYAVIAVPFVCSGIGVCLALTKLAAPIGRLYAADLAGAAVGCLVLVATLRWTDGPTAVFVVALLACAAGVAFAYEAGQTRLLRAAKVLTALLAAFCVGNTILVHHQSGLIRLTWVKGKMEYPPRHESWNSFSRVAVRGNPDEPRKPFGWGLSDKLPEHHKVRQLNLNIDAGAGTVLTAFDGSFDNLQHLRYDLTNLAHYIRQDARVLVVGAGGGRDVLSALLFDQASVTGVEINQNIVDVVTETFGDFTGHLGEHPKVTIVNDEARSFITRQKDRYDILQVSLIDTAAATAAGAYVLTESTLYTVEAWRTFLEHLADSGVMTVSRWYFRDSPAEVYRLLRLATVSLGELGVDRPRDHLILVQQRPDMKWGLPVGLATLLVSRQPFSRQDIATIGDVAARMDWPVTLTPQSAAEPDLATVTSFQQADRFVAAYPLDIEAPTDDCPFFFHMLKPKSLLSKLALTQSTWDYNLTAAYVLGGCLIVVTVMTLLCIVLPLRYARLRVDVPRALPLAVFFGGIGLGFLLIEISQMQRLVVFLGHPTYSLTVVLLTVLLASGLGSLWTQHLVRSNVSASACVHMVLLVGLLIGFGAATPQLLANFAAAITPVRILVAIGVLAPLGFFMGMAFPIGMRLASSWNAALTPWLWGINGATSVCASVLAITIALYAGIAAAYWTGVAAYVIALAAYTWAVFAEAVLGWVPRQEVDSMDRAVAQPVPIASRSILRRAGQHPRA